MRRSPRRTPLTRWRTARRLVAFRWRTLLLLFLTAGVLTFAAVGVLAVRDSSARAATDAALADQGNRAYALQASSDEASARLAADDRVAGVAEQRAQVRHAGAEVSADLRVTTGSSLHLGVLTDGRFPTDSSGLTLSTYAAELLDAEPGDVVRVVDPTEPTAFEDLVLTGITIDPSDREDLTVTRVDPDLPASEVAAWFTDTDPYGALGLGAQIDAGKIGYRSTASVAEEAAASTPVAFADAAYAEPGLALLVLVVLGGIVVAAVPTTRADREGLRAAGWSAGRVWRLYRGVLVMTTLSGVAVGTAAVSLLLLVAREPVSAVLGEQWQGIDVPWVWVVVLAGLCVVAVWSGRLLGGAARSLGSLAGSSTPTPRRVTGFSLLLLLGGTTVLAVAGIASRSDPPGQLTLLAPLGAAVVAAALPGIVLPLVLARVPPATRTLSRRVTGGLHVVTAVVGVVCVLVGSRTAQTTHDTVVFETTSSAPQPAGSLVVSPVPQGAADELASAYAAAGGRTLERFRLVEESPTSMVRVTGPALLACMEEAGTRDPDAVDPLCFRQDTYAPVNTVAIGSADLERPAADPGLLDDVSEVGLLRFAGAEATPAGTVEADPEDGLGGNLPGLVLPPDDPLLGELGLRAADAEMVGARGPRHPVAGEPGGAPGDRLPARTDGAGDRRVGQQ
ncbi:hypothetical protein [Nocardioides zeae]|uniref:FtsX-like permease family protein n=1 Tax=Nocardioides zeae TaxID=1457234 RepID=A0AAJ1U2L1_9ACTN|nr:hypothetical protein [Nocardioides zeae]MDQ1104805.1 hypothetical protein [Nocardioides zeae]